MASERKMEFVCKKLVWFGLDDDFVVMEFENVVIRLKGEVVSDVLAALAAFDDAED